MLRLFFANSMVMHVRAPTSPSTYLGIARAPRSLGRHAILQARRATPTSRSYYHQTETASSGTSFDIASRNLSDLGVRSRRPPDSIEPGQNTLPEIPDSEWEIRTGEHRRGTRDITRI